MFFESAPLGRRPHLTRGVRCDLLRYNQCYMGEKNPMKVLYVGSVGTRSTAVSKAFILPHLEIPNAPQFLHFQQDERQADGFLPTADSHTFQQSSNAPRACCVHLECLEPLEASYHLADDERWTDSRTHNPRNRSQGKSLPGDRLQD